MNREYRIYASVYNAPEIGLVKASLILVVDDRGRLVERLTGPVNIGPSIGRFTDRFARNVVKEYVANRFNFEVDLDSVKLLTYEKLTKMRLKLEDR